MVSELEKIKTTSNYKTMKRTGWTYGDKRCTIEYFCKILIYKAKNRFLFSILLLFIGWVPEEFLSVIKVGRFHL